MTLIDDLRAELAEMLRTRVLVLFGRVVDRVDVEVDDGFLRVPPLGFEAERLIAGMQLPRLVRSASVENDGAIGFHLDRGAVAVEILESPPVLPEGVYGNAADRLLLGDCVSDAWWNVLWPLVAGNPTPQPGSTVLDQLTQGAERTAEARLLQVVVKKALLQKQR